MQPRIAELGPSRSFLPSKKEFKLKNHTTCVLWLSFNEGSNYHQVSAITANTALGYFKGSWGRSRILEPQLWLVPVLLSCICGGVSGANLKKGQKALSSSVREEAEKSKIISNVSSKAWEEAAVGVSSLFPQAVEGSVTQQVHTAPWGGCVPWEEPTLKLQKILRLKELQRGPAGFLPSSQCHCTTWGGRGFGNEGVELSLERQEWGEVFYIFFFCCPTLL